MRTARSVAWLGGPGLVLALGLAPAGCGQLWRPFLQATEPTACEPGCPADLGAPLEDQGPAEWQVVPTGSTAGLAAIWGYDTEQRLFLGGDSGTLLSVDPSGKVTPEVLPPGVQPERFTALSGRTLAAAPGPVVAVGDRNVVIHWNGQSWASMAPSNPIGRTLTAVTVTPSLDVYVAGDAGALYYGRIGGTLATNRLTVAGSGSLTGAAPAEQSGAWVSASSGEVFYVSGGTSLLHRELNGTALNALWEPPVTPLPTDLGTASRPYVVGESGTLAQYDGKSFVRQASTRADETVSGATLTAICGNRAGELWVVGKGGLVLHILGKIWTVVPTGSSAYLRGVWVAPDSDRPWIVGDGGLLMHRRASP